MRGTTLALAGALLLLCATAHADAVSTRATQLRTSSEYKVRLSAALWLGKKKDARSIRAMTHALKNDSERTVRSVVALQLGNLIDESTNTRVRDDAIDALEHAAKKDSDKKVRAKARAAWIKVKALRTPRGGLPAVFVAIGKPSGGKHLNSKDATTELQAVMRKALRSAAPDFGQSTVKDGLPTKSELEKARSAGFFVNASVQSVSVAKKAGHVEVRCKVGIHVNAWNGRDSEERLRENETASATGNGRVKGANTKTSIRNAGRDCVTAVVDQLTERQVVPFIKRSADRRIAKTHTDE